VLKVVTNIAASSIWGTGFGVPFFWVSLFICFLLSWSVPLGRYYR
jgi:hypothetical protein